MEATAPTDQVQEETVAAQEYAPGELAPVIVTQQTVWKPDDFEDKSIIGTFQDLINTVSTTDEAARRFSVLQTWETRHMDRGYQYLETLKDGKWGIVGGNEKNPIGHADDANLYPTNILSAQGDIATGALCRGKIKVDFAPKRSKQPKDVAASDEANKYKYLWEKRNRNLQREIADAGWTDCRVLVWTRSVADKRFGINEDGRPRIAEISSAHGVLETKLPMMVDKLEDCGYAQVFEEVDYAVARASYPWMGNKIKPSWGTFGELEFERIARINTRIGIVGKYITGTSGIRETTMGYCWFRPGMYFDDKVTVAQREFLLKEFPDGLFVVMAGAELCCCWNESMDDHLSLGMFTRGFGQNRRSLGSSDVPIQKRINIWADLWDKFVRRAIPFAAMDADTWNPEALAQLEADPGRYVPVTPPEGQVIEQTFALSPAPQPIPQMAEMLQWYLGPLIQSIDGATPALFGGGEGQDNTVGATQIRLNQALERYGPPWIMVNLLFASAARQAAICCGENGTDQIFDTIDGVGDVSVDPMRLKGDVECSPETINAIPESGAQREAKILQILDMAQVNPQVASIVGTPSNAREIVKALHIDDVITVDEANWEDAALEDIELLLDSEPLLNPDWQELSSQIEVLTVQHDAAKAMVSSGVAEGNIPGEDVISQGEQMEQQLSQLEQQLQSTPKWNPSIAVPQDDSQDHSTIAATVLAWMGEPDGRAIRRAASREPEGGQNWKKWTNVFTYWQGHRDMAAKLAAANTPPIPPKMTISIPVDKIQGDAQAQLLAKAGIQVQGPTGQPHEVEQEARVYTPVSEIVTKTKRRL